MTNLVCFDLNEFKAKVFEKVAQLNETAVETIEVSNFIVTANDIIGIIEEMTKEGNNEKE